MAHGILWNWTIKNDLVDYTVVGETDMEKCLWYVKF